MFGFIVGTICLVGLVGLVAGKRRRRCHGGRHHRWHRGGKRMGREGAFRAAGEVFKRRLDIDEDQGDIVDHALRDLRDVLKELKESLGGSREEVAEAFRGDSVDDARLAVVFDRHDEELEAARRGVVSALKQVHAVLDADQREQAADWLASARPGWSS